jgi:hypothetical protein
VKESVYNQTKSLITYVCLSKKHPLRNFTQLDSNYFSKETCKKVQALLYSVEFLLFRKLGMSYIFSCN